MSATPVDNTPVEAFILGGLGAFMGAMAATVFHIFYGDKVKRWWRRVTGPKADENVITDREGYRYVRASNEDNEGEGGELVAL